jgi:hypothetical protein
VIPGITIGIRHYPTKMLKLKLLAAICLVGQVFAFLPQKMAVSQVRSLTFFKTMASSEDDLPADFQGATLGTPSNTFLAASMTGLVSGLYTLFPQVCLAADNYELEQLPPPYVPAIFAVVLLAGVGVLTGSLGNVMDEGALLNSSPRFFTCLS